MSLYKKLLDYSEKDIYAFHMPGHKRNLSSEKDIYKMDITEIYGMDDLHDPEGIILEEMERASKLYKSDYSFLLVNGSTVGNLCAIYATCKRDDTVLIERSCHKSVYNAAQITGCKLDYIYPKIQNNIYKGVSVDEIEKAFQNNDNIRAVVVTSPTYEGYVSPIKEIAEIVHQNGAVLIVDAAHGAHLGFCDYFPESPVIAGADIVIMSLHKTLPALTQTAVMHIKGDFVDRNRIEEAIDIFETSSPSYVLMGSISKAFDEVEKENIFEIYSNRLNRFYEETKKLNCLKIIDGKADNRDASKIIISTAQTNISGPDLAKICRDKYGIEFEMSSFNYVLAMTSIADTDEGFDRLKNALFEIDRTLVEKNYSEEEFSINIKPIKQLELCAAKAENYEIINLDDAKGRISFSEICIYPPGSPIVVPGELIDEDVIKLVNAAKAAGLHVTGMKENTLRVVKG